MSGVRPSGSGHSPKGGAASSTASPAQPSVPNAPPPTPNPAVRQGALLSRSGHRWSHTNIVYCLDCGLKYRDWLRQRVSEMGR
jgi:hypothetical protein